MKCKSLELAYGNKPVLKTLTAGAEKLNWCSFKKEFLHEQKPEEVNYRHELPIMRKHLDCEKFLAKFEKTSKPTKTHAACGM